ncbi:MAG: chaperone NapD [Pseudoruegeria sp.]
MSELAHISSLLITAKPETLDAVSRQIESLPCAEVAMRDPAGKLVVAMETETERAIIDALDIIQILPGVVNASLVFHQIDDGQDGLPE